MKNEHTKAFRVKRAASILIRAEADLMGIKIISDDRKNFELDMARLRVLEDDIIDFTHAMLHRLSDALQGHVTKEFIDIPIGKSTYVVINNNVVIRSAILGSAETAYKKLKPKAKVGEELFIRVRDK